MDTKELIGWSSSLILVATLGWQVYKQWKSGNSEGVSTLLFIGQMTASIGFAVYSWLVDNKVFVFTNSLMVINGLLGYAIVVRNRRKSQAG